MTGDGPGGAEEGSPGGEPEDDGSDPPPLVVSLVVPLPDPPEPDPVVPPDPSDGWSVTVEESCWLWPPDCG